MAENLLLEYALKNHEKILRPPVGHLKHPFIVPGSVYTHQLWDWDSWLTDVALHQFVPYDISRYEKGCVINFLENIDERGRIPIVIVENRLPNIPEGVNVHKPCLAQHAAFIVKNENGNAEWLRPYFDRLLRFVDFYRTTCRHENGLYFWLNDLSIGVDNDPCTFFRPNRSSASILLNCFMYKELEAISYLAKCLQLSVPEYEKEKDHLKQSVQTLCYDEKDGFYYSADLNLLPIGELHKGAPRHWDCLIQRIGCWSGFLAMWSGIATPKQAERMVRENLLDERSFWAPHGVRTLSKYEKMYTIKPSGNPSCWLGPIWGSANYLVFRGLVKYGFMDEARILAQRTVDLFIDDLRKTGELHEYYDPESGEPVYNAGFQSWNLLTVNLYAWLHGEPVSEEF